MRRILRRSYFSKHGDHYQTLSSAMSLFRLGCMRLRGMRPLITGKKRKKSSLTIRKNFSSKSKMSGPIWRIRANGRIPPARSAAPSAAWATSSGKSLPSNLLRNCPIGRSPVLPERPRMRYGTCNGGRSEHCATILKIHTFYE